MVIFVLALRLKVVASMKVMPSAEFAAGLHHVVEIDVVLDLERRGLVVADHAGAAGHGRDVADRLLGRVRGGRVRRGGIGRRRRCGGLRGTVCACASCVSSDEAAKTSVAPIVVLQANSSSAKDSWRDIGNFRSRGGQKAGPADFSAVSLNAG